MITGRTKRRMVTDHRVIVDRWVTPMIAGVYRPEMTARIGRSRMLQGKLNIGAISETITGQIIAGAPMTNPIAGGRVRVSRLEIIRDITRELRTIGMFEVGDRLKMISNIAGGIRTTGMRSR